MEDQNKYLGYMDRDGERYLIKDISAHKKMRIESSLFLNT